MDTPDTLLEQLPLFPAEKRCHRCQAVKPLEAFNRWAQGVYGRHAYCRSCSREYKREGYKRRKAGLLTEGQQLRAQGLKLCRDCDRARPLDAFKRQGTRRFSLCKECQRARRLAARRAILGDAYGLHDRLLAQGLKRCSGCDQVKELRDFGDHARARDGLNWWCKACNVANATAYYAANTAAKIAYARAYYDANRVAIRAAARAQLQQLRESDPAALRALYSAHYRRYKESSTERVKAWVQKNPERRRQMSRESYHRNKSNGKHIVYSHNRRARLKAAPGRLSSADIVMLYDVQRGRCAYCLAPLSEGFHRDHMTAVGPTGPNSVENIALACGRCNRRKHTRSAGRFLALLLKERRKDRAQKLPIKARRALCAQAAT